VKVYSSADFQYTFSYVQHVSQFAFDVQNLSRSSQLLSVACYDSLLVLTINSCKSSMSEINVSKVSEQ